MLSFFMIADIFRVIDSQRHLTSFFVPHCHQVVSHIHLRGLLSFNYFTQSSNASTKNYMCPERYSLKDYSPRVLFLHSKPIGNYQLLKISNFDQL